MAHDPEEEKKKKTQHIQLVSFKRIPRFIPKLPYQSHDGLTREPSKTSHIGGRSLCLTRPTVGRKRRESAGCVASHLGLVAKEERQRSVGPFHSGFLGLLVIPGKEIETSSQFSGYLKLLDGQKASVGLE